MNPGRPLQGSKKAQDEKMDGRATDSGQESETEHEQSSGQEFATLMENIREMDRELAQVCAENLSKQFDLSFLDRQNMDTSVKNLTLMTGC